jgi:hypothetical protein
MPGQQRGWSQTNKHWISAILKSLKENDGQGFYFTPPVNVRFSRRPVNTPHLLALPSASSFKQSYFFDSLCKVDFWHHLQYFLNSNLRSTDFLFLRVV